jgi:NAD(P)-dependent dehydrogenase (short-subunit alcohol dehydrogenase family)
MNEEVAVSETSMERSIWDMFSLQGKVAVVTGANSHLGSAFASVLAQAGATVVATSRDLDRAQKFAASLPASNGVRHWGVELDQMAPESINRAIDKVVEETGRIDVLVNNANEPFGDDWKSITPEIFTRQISNATSYFLLARRCRDLAVERGSSASIILLASMYGSVGSYPDAYDGIGPGSPVAYHTLKGGIISLMRYLAVYWAKDGVRVNSLSPGPFPSQRANPELVARLKGKLPLGRVGRPTELQGALLLLASDAGSYITGTDLVVDGGWTAW